MKLENEQLADQILVLLKSRPMTPEELSTSLLIRDDKRVPYVLGQMVRKGRVIRLGQQRYGHPVRVSSAAPPPLFDEAV